MSILQESKEAAEHSLMLHMMSRIENEPEISQRALSSHLGVAIGLVNTYLKKCIQKGWIKVQHIPTRRYTYYLTPKGFIEKTRLTGHYLKSSFSFFREARTQFMSLFEYCEQKHWQTIILMGSGDLTDIATQVGKGTSLRIIGKNLSDLLDKKEFDAVIITDDQTPQATYEFLLEHIKDEERILAPVLLHLSKPHKLSGEQL